MRRPLPLIGRLRKSQDGVAFSEFALILPFFAALMLSGLELSNLILANMKVQRLATMAADLVAQRGAHDDGISELQIADLFSALDVSARPFDLRNRGRIAVSAVLGEDTNGDGNSDGNRVKWQRFDGRFIEAPLVLGCWTEGRLAVLHEARALNANESLFHAQVTYEYDALFSNDLLSLFQVPTTITRVAMYRARGSTFQDIQTSVGFPPKSNCASPDGT